MRLVRVFYHEHFLRVIVKVLAQLVTKVGVGVAVAYNLYGLRCAYAAMVCRDDNSKTALREQFEEV